MYYLKRHNVKDFSIDKCTRYNSSAPLAAYKARAQTIAEHEHTTCDVIDERGNVIFVAFAH